MSEYLEMTVIIALVAAFVVLLVRKWGIDEWMQVHGDGVMAKLFSCLFCMSFWACVIISLVVVLVTDEGIYVLCPFAAVPMTRLLQL